MPHKKAKKKKSSTPKIRKDGNDDDLEDDTLGEFSAWEEAENEFPEEKFPNTIPRL